MVGGCYFLILDGFLDFFDFGGFSKIFIFLVKTGTGGTGTGGRRNRPEPNRTVGFLVDPARPGLGPAELAATCGAAGTVVRTI